MDSFKGYFKNNTKLNWGDDFFYFPKNDSLFMKDFLKDDYFFRNWQEQHSEFENIIKRMDSSRNDFIKKIHPGLMESIEKN